ncbi:MAG: pro-sigmaK processing inhibitor BofA family protein [Lachnospiraceae bacterium]|nr:pro-sigmaK processing inhibitor BofA family protein [Lachnospiraceae bacterium]
MIAIYFMNAFLDKLGISSCVGINVYTVLTSGVLGFPGIAALYGIGIYKSL